MNFFMVVLVVYVVLSRLRRENGRDPWTKFKLLVDTVEVEIVRKRAEKEPGDLLYS